MAFACRQCGACCRIPDGIVRVSDAEIARIAAYLGMSEGAFIERECEVAPDRRGLVLHSRPDGACAWLTDDNRCRIHAVKPDKCRTFPHEWSNADSDRVCPGLRAGGMRAIVSLGSNVEPRAGYLARAREALAALPGTRLVQASSVIETEPVDVPDAFAHLKFLNQVVVLETTLAVDDFARRMHGVEDALGRVRTVRNGPRTVDLDLVDFDGLVRDDPVLTLPHPRARERDFVMRPLAELGVEF